MSVINYDKSALSPRGMPMVGLATARMEADTLDRFLSLPVWQEPAPEITETVSAEDRAARQAEIRTLLSRRAGGFLADVPFALVKPMQIAVRNLFNF